MKVGVVERPKRRDPRKRAMSDPEFERLVTAVGLEQAALLEYEERMRQQSISDTVCNTFIAQEALEALTADRDLSGLKQFDANYEAIMGEITHIATLIIKMTQAPRVLARDGQLVSPQFSAYFYALQYIYLVEVQVAIEIDAVLFAACCLSHAHLKRTWESYRRRADRDTLFQKLSELKIHDVHFFEEFLDRGFRNALAHGDYFIEADGTLIVGAVSGRGSRRLDLSQVIDIFDGLTDLAQITYLFLWNLRDRAGRIPNEEPIRNIDPS
jgi:hypothetical protein